MAAEGGMMAAAIVAGSIAAGACTDMSALLPMTASEQIATTTAARLAELKDKSPKVLLNNAAGTKEWKLWANAGPGVLVKGVKTPEGKRAYPDLVTVHMVTKWAAEHLVHRTCHTTKGILIAGGS